MSHQQSSPSRGDESLRINPKWVAIAATLITLWLALSPGIIEPAREDATTAAAIVTLTTTVGKLEAAVSGLSEKLNSDRAVYAAELADLRVKADAGQRDRQDLRERLNRLEERNSGGRRGSGGER